MVSDLLGVSGQRMLHALAEGEHDASSLAQMGDPRLRASERELADALNGDLAPVQGEILKLLLKRVELVEQQMGQLDQLAAAQLRPHQDCQ